MVQVKSKGCRIKTGTLSLSLEDKVKKYADHLYQISDMTCGSCWYLDMQPWQRQDLSKEELYEYAEQMREIINKVFDVAYCDELCNDNLAKL